MRRDQQTRLGVHVIVRVSWRARWENWSSRVVEVEEIKIKGDAARKMCDEKLSQAEVAIDKCNKNSKKNKSGKRLAVEEAEENAAGGSGTGSGKLSDAEKEKIRVTSINPCLKCLGDAGMNDKEKKQLTLSSESTTCQICFSSLRNFGSEVVR